MIKIKKILASFLAATIIAGLVPVNVLAATEESTRVEQALEGSIQNNLILTLESTVSDTFRFKKFYLSVDGYEKSFTSLKANVITPTSIGDDSIIEWSNDNEEVVQLRSNTGITNRITANGSGRTKISASFSGLVASAEVIVSTVEEAKSRIKELMVLLPDNYNDLTMNDLTVVDECYGLMMSAMNSRERTSFGKEEGNEKFAKINGFMYRDAMEQMMTSVTSTNISPSGASYENTGDIIDQFEAGREYYSNEQREILDSIILEFNALDPMATKELLYSEYVSKLRTLRDKIKEFVLKIVNEIKSLDELTLNDEGYIVSVRNAYSILYPTYKNFIDINKLLVAENKIAELKSIVEVESISISPKDSSIIIGETLQLEKEILPKNSSDKSVTWISSDENVATVNEYGVVTAVSEGIAIVSATTSNGKSDTLAITVKSDGVVEVTGINLVENASVIMGQKIQLNATVEPESATNKKIIWTSSDESIATVNEKGEVIAIKQGIVSIIATSGNISAKCELVVNNRPEVTNPQVYFKHDNGLIQEANEDNTIVLEQSDSGRFCVEGYDDEVTWYTDGDSTTGKVLYIFGNTGEYLPAKIGNANAWITNSDMFDSKKILDFKVEVVPSTISEIKTFIDGEEMNNNTITINGSENRTISVKGRKEGESTFKEVPYYALSITSPSESVEFGTSVDRNVFLFNKPDTAKIIVSIDNNTKVNKYFYAKSQEVKVEKITVTVPETCYINEWNPNGQEYVGITTWGGEQRYTLEIYPENASNKNIVWENLNADVAIFKREHVNGFLPYKAGEANFIARSASDSSIKTEVKINFEYKNKAEAVTIDKNEFNLDLSQNLQLPIKYTPANTTEQRMDWSYSEEGIVKVTSNINSSSQGNIKNTIHTVTPIKEGKVIVTGTPWDNTSTAEPIIFTITVGKDLDITIDYDSIVNTGIESSKDYLNQDSISKNTYGDEWNIFSLVRSGGNISDEDKANYLNSIIEESKKTSFGRIPTDIERVVLGLLSIGKNPADIDGVNLFEKIYNHKNIEIQGSNGVSYALIALDAVNTEIPEDAKWTREKLISILLSYQVEDGSFSLTSGGVTGSVDITSMSLQALAKYNRIEYPEVQDSILKALEYLKSEIKSDGGYGNSNSTSQVLTALSVLGIDPLDDENGFTIGLNNVISNLETYRVKDGGFKYLITDKTANTMATQQALYSLEAYRRYKAGENSLYDLTDIKIDDDITETPETKPEVPEVKPEEPETKPEVPENPGEKPEVPVTPEVTPDKDTITTPDKEEVGEENEGDLPQTGNEKVIMVTLLGIICLFAGIAISKKSKKLVK